MDWSERFTDGRVPEPGIRTLFSQNHRWQRWLDVEAALAQAEAAEGMVPAAAAVAITKMADLNRLEVARIRADIRRESHPVMPLVSELSRVVGKPYGSWVHWGATSRNITQTGDALVLREAHDQLSSWLGEVFSDLATLADDGAEMVCAGRTHGQHAVPITFGFKVAAWIDELGRGADRLEAAKVRACTAMMGGAVGNYAAFGERGPAVQAEVARLLGLTPMPLPYRATVDSLAEYVSALGVLAGTGGRIAKEVFRLMQPEFGEVSEPVPVGTVGSSTMPHKRNPQLTDDCVAISAQVRALVPLALEAMLHDHDVSGGFESMMDEALRRSCTLMGDLLVRLHVILAGLALNPERMRTNLDLTDGLTMSEAVMLALGKTIGRQEAHQVVYEAAQQAAAGHGRFVDRLRQDARVSQHLAGPALSRLLDPTNHVGRSVTIAHEQAKAARKRAAALRPELAGMRRR